MTLEIKTAGVQDLAWVNATYKTINFLPSTLEDEIVAMAHVDGVKAGLGRIAVVDRNSCELGGMYVIPDFRGKAIARKLVDFLLEHAQRRLIYCIPFEHLLHFYESFGFRKVEDMSLVPEKIKKKLDFTKKAYKESTTLLMMYR